MWLRTKCNDCTVVSEMNQLFRVAWHKILHFLGIAFPEQNSLKKLFVIPPSPSACDSLSICPTIGAGFIPCHKSEPHQPAYILHEDPKSFEENTYRARLIESNISDYCENIFSHDVRLSFEALKRWQTKAGSPSSRLFCMTCTPMGSSVGAVEVISKS